MKERIAKLNHKLGDKLQSGAFLAPSLIGVIIFFIAPFFVVIYYSLIDSTVSNNFVFLDNFIAVLKNEAFSQAAKNTAVFSAIAVPLAVILALGLAVLLEQRIPFKSQFRTFFLSPLMVPVASIVLIWQVIFHLNGSLNEALSVFGFGKIDWFKSDYSQFPIILLFLWKNLGYNMILFMAALNNIPRDLVEVAKIEGASPMYTFWRVKMRFLSPTILFVTLLSVINSFKVFREIYLLTGDHPYASLYMLQHYMNNMFNSLNYQRLAAAAIIMAVVIIILVALMFIVENWYGKDVEG